MEDLTQVITVLKFILQTPIAHRNQFSLNMMDSHVYLKVITILRYGNKIDRKKVVKIEVVLNIS